MARFSDVNELSFGPSAIYRLKEVLKAAGWVVQSSSDGSTYNASGDEITQMWSGAGGMNNSKAWFVIRDPGDSHEWCFQRGTASPYWRVKISSLDRHIGGTPSAIRVPSATDEIVLLGSGTDASPGFATLFYTDWVYRAHIIAESTPVGAITPVYGFVLFTTDAGSSIPKTLIMQEPMKIGSFPELSSGTRLSPVIGDPDPVIYVCSYQANSINFELDSSGLWNSSNPNANVSRGWYKMNYGDQSSTYFAASYIFAYSTTNGRVAPASATSVLGPDAHTGQDILFPIIIARDRTGLTQVGLKGICNTIKSKTINRNYPSVLNLTTDAKVYVKDLILPWPNDVLPLT